MLLLLLLLLLLLSASGSASASSPPMRCALVCLRASGGQVSALWPSKRALPAQVGVQVGCAGRLCSMPDHELLVERHELGPVRQRVLVEEAQPFPPQWPISCANLPRSVTEELSGVPQ